MTEETKPVGQIVVHIYGDRSLQIQSTVEDQNEIRDILHTAEEMVIRTALMKASKKSNLVMLNNGSLPS